ncbi:MAG TPA: hypothetical protein DDY20_11985 [Desulfobulbaceae bacterium]|nr:hypothetical protein [Desulfobulbaceae bacterium]
MKNLPGKIVLAVVFLLFSAFSAAHAATKGRIMTNGKVTLIKNGLPITTYTEQGPLDENALISCEGTCMVKMQGISLSAVDQTNFALKESADSVSLFVGSGKIYFVVMDASQRFSFYSPNSYYVKTEGFIAPVAKESAVKGFISVKDDITEIGMDTGSMIVQTDQGTQTVNPGQSIVLAMVDVPDDVKGVEEKSSGEESDAQEGTFSWANLTDNPQLTTLVVGVGVVGAVGLGSALIWHNANDDDDGGEPPAPPPPEPPAPRPPASPNR